MVNCGPLAATGSISVTAHARTSTSSPSRRRPRSRLAWKRTAPQPTRGGMNKGNAPSDLNGFYKRNGARAHFDQQPIEAQTTVSACLEAYRATADPWWYEQAQCAFDWFLGWNDLGLELYARQTGGCRDGLHADRSNENQGAESMLAFLLSLAEMRLIQNTANGFQPAGLAASMAQ